MSRIMIHGLLSFALVLQNSALTSSLRPVGLLHATEAKSDLASAVYEVLANHEAAGSLAYVTTCKNAPEQFLNSKFGPFPPQEALDDSLNGIVRAAPRITWSRRNVIELRDKCLKDGLLKIRIKEIVLKNIINPGDVVDAILGTTEVKEYLDKNHYVYEQVGSVLQGLRRAGTEAPAINLANITVEEVMNRALKMFPGIWIYVETPNDERHHQFELYIREFTIHH